MVVSSREWASLGEVRKGVFFALVSALNCLSGRRRRVVVSSQGNQ